MLASSSSSFFFLIVFLWDDGTGDKPEDHTDARHSEVILSYGK